MADYLRQTADSWNDSIERWTYIKATDLANELGVDGYYVRIAPPETADAASPAEGFVPIKNRPPGLSLQPASHIISPDALALVRFGLRSAKDPRIINTIKVIDALLKTETPSGPVWHRYNDDGYGEHEDGAPFDGTGIGRGWPLLIGERGHYELAAGDKARAKELLQALAGFSNESGLLPEQAWDTDDIQEKELFLGRPSGSAMPLVWAHAEYMKLHRSLVDGRVFDMPAQTVARYLEKETRSPYAAWRFNQKRSAISYGQILRLELPAMATINWSDDRWRTTNQVTTRDTGLGLFIADLPTEKHAIGSEIGFTFYWLKDESWQGEDFAITVHSGVSEQ